MQKDVENSRGLFRKMIIYMIWLVVPTPLKKYEFVNWDDDNDDIPNIWENKIHVPVRSSHHQPAMYLISRDKIVAPLGLSEAKKRPEIADFDEKRWENPYVNSRHH